MDLIHKHKNTFLPPLKHKAVIINMYWQVKIMTKIAYRMKLYSPYIILKAIEQLTLGLSTS